MSPSKPFVQPAERHSLLLWDKEDLESGIVLLFLSTLLACLVKMFFYSLSLQKLIAVLLPLLAQGARDVGQEAKRTVQVLMKKHHQLSVFVGEEYVGEAQEAKELKHMAGGQGRSRAESHWGKAEGHGDKAEGNEEEAEGHEEEAEGHEEEAKKLAERHMRNQLLGMFICVAL